MIRRFAPHLLRGHVPDGTHHRAGLGVLVDRLQARVRAAAQTRLLREAEVEYLHTPLVCHEDVLWLQVAVDDPLLVGCGQPLGHLHGEVDGLAGGKSAIFESCAQRLAFEELHDGVGSFTLSPEVVDGEDVRVGELGDRARLALEAGERLGIVGQIGGEDLDGHVAVELGIPCAVDLAHATGAEVRENLVRTQAGAGGESHYLSRGANSREILARGEIRGAMNPLAKGRCRSTPARSASDDSAAQCERESRVVTAASRRSRVQRDARLRAAAARR